MQRLASRGLGRLLIALAAIGCLLVEHGWAQEPPRSSHSRHPKSGYPPRKPGKPDKTDKAEDDAAPPADDPGPPPSDLPKAPAEAPRPPAIEPPHGPVGKLRFQFRYQPWREVLDWFAQQADLSLIMDAPPQGTFNYSDSREYTPTEAIDLLNSVLLTKGYTLVRRDRMLMLINLEDGIPANLVSTVPLESLDAKGEFELISVLFNLERLKPEEAEAEIKRLLGPQGSVVPLAKSRQILVTDTAGRLRAVRTVLARIEGPGGAGSTGVQTFELKFVRADDVLPILRQLLDIPEDKPQAADGSIRIASEAATGRLFVSGRPEKVARVAEVIKGLDVAPPGTDPNARVVGTPQLEVYAITGTDPAAALAVLQTLLTGQPDVRLALDPKTNSLIAMARPAQQATIRATLDQLQRDGQRLEVIRLRRVDPQTAVLSINKLFSSADKGASPLVDADPASQQLMIRGTESQIKQIRGLLEKMGEDLTPGGTKSTGHVRTLPMSGGAARSTLERAQEIWPTLRPNPVRVMSPPAEKPGEAAEPAAAPGAKPAAPAAAPVLPPLPPDPSVLPPLPPDPPAATPPEQHSAELPGGARVIFVSESSAAAASESPTAAPREAPAPIVVMPGPNGITIASEDTEALDEFERLLTTIAEGTVSSGREITVFYLRHAKAASVGETLDRLFGGGTSDVAMPGATPPAAAAAAGGSAAEPAGVLNSLGRPGARRILATGPIRITPDVRLNALLVQANRADLDNIQQMLKILDQKESPEDVSVSPKPRMIPVQYSHAKDIADIVKQVYADRMLEGTANQQQSVRPWFMVGGNVQSAQPKRTDVNNLTVGVDGRTNTLIVVAPDPLFEEVKQLVDQLDVAAADQTQTVRVVSLHRTSAAAVEQALSAIVGDSAQVGRVGGGEASMPPPGMSPFGWPSRSGRMRGGPPPMAAPSSSGPTYSAPAYRPSGRSSSPYGSSPRRSTSGPPAYSPAAQPGPSAGPASRPTGSPGSSGSRRSSSRSRPSAPPAGPSR